jgi:site-specific recombinase XerD
MVTNKENCTVSKARRRREDKKGRRQVIIRLRIKTPECEHDFNVYRTDGTPLKLNVAQYSNLTDENYYLITNAKSIIKQAAIQLVLDEKDISLESLNQRISSIQEYDVVQKVNSYSNTELEITKDDIEQINKDINLDDVEELEDVAEILAWGKVELDKKDKQKRLLNATKEKDTLKRTIVQYKNLEWDKNNLLLAIGYLFTIEKDNEDPLINTLYRGIINNLYDFQLNTNASNKITDFDDTYCRNFIKYIVRVGVIKSSLGKTSFELNSGKYDYYFKKKEHKIISYSTLKDKIKALNSICSNLGLHGLSKYKIDKYSPDTFVKKSVNTSKGSNIDHHLKPHEVKQMLNKKIDNPEMELSKDIFLILLFSGGLRGIKDFDVIINREENSLNVLHPKVKKRCLIPVFKEMKQILEKYNYQFPDFSELTSISDNLKEIATYFGWTRQIKSDNTFVNKKSEDSYYFNAPLNEVIDMTFARKSFVYYARREYKMPDGEIIQYTGHSNVELLAYYMGEYTLEEMRSRLDQNKD